MRRRMVPALSLFLILILMLTGCSKRDEELAFKVDGVVEAEEVDVAAKIPGRIETIQVKEGDTVKAGQVLAYIEVKELKEKEKQAQAALEAARAQYEKAQNALLLQEKASEADLQAARAALNQAMSQYDKAKKGPRAQQVEQARAKLDQAKAALEVAEKSYQRTKQLFESGAVSQQVLDEVKAKYEAARQEMRYAEEGLNLLEEGTQEEDIRAAAAAVQQAQAALLKAEAGKIQVLIAKSAVQMAEADLKRAEAALAEVRSNLEEAAVKAPRDGVIAVKYVDEGEMIAAGMPLFTIQQPEKNWVNVKVKETLVGQIKEGQKVKVTSPNFPGKTFDGQVESIRQKPDYATQRATNERGEKDIVAYNVKVRLDHPELKAGMSVTVDFQATQEEQ
ncbi:HlyD family secretion protein [Thermanaeromonas sp. C210]|uniref:HlyD family secretion protein n=1 Tax=Thermanaeromonas sp. C210 TaxID=2731925 RepID=UPI00155B9B39|nr:efflux RND transporter periplasmic adaptor subunit [Thermanaeromonas sp. C210]GFN21823.1 secretion protein HlyD [Thermanaeromonas sp. C210]